MDPSVFVIWWLTLINKVVYYFLLGELDLI